MQKSAVFYGETNKPTNMNINPRKPLHAHHNGTAQWDEDINQETLENSNVNGEEPSSTESGSDSYEDEVDTTYYSHAEYNRRESFEMSRSVPRTPQRPKQCSRYRSPSVQNFIPESKKPVIPSLHETAKSSPLTSILAFLVIAIIVGVYSLGSPSVKYCSYEKLQKQYPGQEEDLWRTLKVGIELILNGYTHSPAVYLFVHHGGANAFQLVKDIAKHSSECFGPQMRPIEIESDDFIATTGADKDYGYAIEKYRAKIKEGNVFLIANLNEIPPEAARALHTICDTYSPIAENVVIFLTLTIPPIVEGTVVSNAENTLIELWSKLDRNELDPLITRVTDQVIPLQS